MPSQCRRTQMRQALCLVAGPGGGPGIFGILEGFFNFFLVFGCLKCPCFCLP